MSATIKVEIDGAILDLAECCWFEHAPCGCISGLSVVKPDALDRDIAWARHHDSIREMKDRKREGFTFALGRLSDASKASLGCSHHPKWGGDRIGAEDQEDET